MSTPFPTALSSMAPGPELAAALAEIDVATLPGFDTVTVMGAAYRQSCHERAVFLRALLETGLREPGSGANVLRASEPGEFAAEEARAALLWSRRRASDTFALAHDIFVRLPRLGEMMLAGELDEPRAVAFTTWTRDLDDVHARLICDELLDEAARLTVGALIDHIRRLAIALDPDWAERRYRSAVAERRVVGSRNPDGSADVAGKNLPIDRAKAGCDRIDALARSCKAAGDARPIDHIRADLFLSMIDGTFVGMGDDEIVSYVLSQGDPEGGDFEADVPAEEATEGDDSEGEGPEGEGPEGEGPEGDDDGDGGRRGPGGSNGGGPGPVGDGGRCDDGRRDGASSPLARRWGVREVRVELTTLIGRDDRPGEIPPWGYLPANVARAMIADMLGAEWRFVICDNDGRAICSGITSARPLQVQGRSLSTGGARRGIRRGTEIVELQVRASDLCWLDAACAEDGCFPEWAAVINDIAGRVDAGDVDTDAAADEVRRRFPRAGLRRFVEVRARYCTHPACRAPASQGDVDHAREHSEGGATESGNLHPPCRHDHRLRHDGGWRVGIEESGQVRWTGGLGHEYISGPPAVMVDTPWRWTRQLTEAAGRPEVRQERGVRGRARVLDVDGEPPF